MALLAEAERPQLRRVRFADGAETTLHVACYPRAAFRAGVARIAPPSELTTWARGRGVEDAIVGGFFIRAAGTPLGELRLDGVAQPAQPFDPPWDRIRACLHVDGDSVSCGPRARYEAEPGGDLLQAGPLLVAAGAVCLGPEPDPEGFSTGAHQFDSDITSGRYPRAALGITRSLLIAVVCDGRGDRDAGMSLTELAATMVGLGAEDAINLDGGGSASLLVGGELVNVPREEHGRPLPGGRPISTAVTFSRR